MCYNLSTKFSFGFRIDRIEINNIKCKRAEFSVSFVALQVYCNGECLGLATKSS